MPTIVFAGHAALPDRLAESVSVVIDGDRIAEIREGASAATGATVAHECGWILPGFIDVHVHGLEGLDALDDSAPVAAIAERMPRFGVTAFCPTTVACSPSHLAGVLDAVAAARRQPSPAAARVLPAHLESNFINPDYRGAQPLSCLVAPPGPGSDGPGATPEATYSGRDIMEVISARQAQVGIVTMAPELPHGLDLVRTFTGMGYRVSLGHSGANYGQAREAIAAGACHATHLFNRMTPLGHRDPGLAGAVLESQAVATELICDGHHVHPATMNLAFRLKGPRRVIAITDGTSGSGLPRGSFAHLGGRRITVADTALLDDGTFAGSVLTMDAAFRNVMTLLGQSPLEASWLCATNPADQLGLKDQGRLAVGALADFVVMDAGMRPIRTFVGGREVWSRSGS